MSAPRIRVASLALLAAASAALAGCAQTISFGSPSGLSNGVDSKGWNRPSYVDGPLYDPGQLQYRRTVNFYDLATSGDTMQIGASLLDTLSTHYLGYTRQFSDSGDWGQVGNGFQSVGSFIASSTDVGAVTIGAGPGGIFLDTLFDSANPRAPVTSEYASGSWNSVTSANTHNLEHSILGDEFLDTPAATTVFDALGRAYVFYVDVLLPGANLNYGFWQASAQSTSGGGLSAATLVETTARPAPTAHWDGVRFACTIYELQSGALKSGCLDTAGSLSPLPTPTLKSIDASGVYGHGSATDGAGNLMVVYYKKASGVVHVYAAYGTTSTGPTWSTPLQIDAGAGVPAPDLSAPTTNATAAPGVAYLGNGNFVAVWVGQSTGSTNGDPNNWTQLYTSTYYAGLGWTTATALSNTLDLYYSQPHPRAMHVFGNGNNNAGYALNTIYNPTCGNPLLGPLYDHCIKDESAYFSSPWCYPASPTYPVCVQPSPIPGGPYSPQQVLWVSRFQIDEGWLTTYSPYNQYQMGCRALNQTDPTAPTMTAPDGSPIGTGYCTARPTGAIFPSGNALVLFQVQDNDGNFRLGGIEFR